MITEIKKYHFKCDVCGVGVIGERTGSINKSLPTDWLKLQSYDRELTFDICPDCQIICSLCEGAKRILDKWCPFCHGKGKVIKSEHEEASTIDCSARN